MKKHLNWLLSAACLLLSSVAFGDKLPEYGGTLVNDFANLIPESQELNLLSVVKEYENQTSVQICIVTVNSISEEYDINSFTTALFNKWGVGQARANNGILIVVSISPRGWFIQPGYGLEGAVPDLSVKHVGEANFPSNFRNGDFYAGLLGAVQDLKKTIGPEAWDIREKLKREKEAEMKASMDEFINYLITFAIVIFAIIIVAVIHYKRKKARLRMRQVIEERKRHKEKLEREHAENIRSAQAKKNKMPADIRDTQNAINTIKEQNPRDYQRHSDEIKNVTNKFQEVGKLNPETQPDEVHGICNELLNRLSAITKDITEKQVLTSNIFDAHIKCAETVRYKQTALNNVVEMLQRLGGKYPTMPLIVQKDVFTTNVNTYINDYKRNLSEAKSQVENLHYDSARTSYTSAKSILEKLSTLISNTAAFESQVKTAESYMATAQRTLAIPEANCGALLNDSDVTYSTREELRQMITSLKSFDVNKFSQNPLDGQKIIVALVKDAETLIEKAKRQIRDAEAERKRKADAIAAELAAARERERERERARERERQRQSSSSSSRSTSSMGGGRSGGAGAGGSW